MSLDHPQSDALKIPNVRFFLGSIAFFTLASRALVVVIGLQIYLLTKSPLALGILGLVEAIPIMSLALLGGHMADRFDRKRILLITRSASILCAFLLALLSYHPQSTNIYGLYLVIFIAGVARGFADPAMTAFEAQIVPKHLTVNGASWVSSTFLSCAILGPSMVGFSYESFGIFKTYLILTGLFFLSFVCTWKIQSQPHVIQSNGESILESIAQGCRFVFNEQILWGAMVLDLIAVLFGGVMALLPIFAVDILHVGARGLGFLEAAPALGALIIAIYSTRYPPIRHAGRNLLLAVTGFGISIIIFALSKNFALSLLALFFSGIFDGISMVIRRSIIRLMSPDHLRGRVASVNWMFVSASNELGALESGLLAHLIGVIPCVWVGGSLTLVVAAVMAILTPKLRRLAFDPHKMEIIKHPQP